MRARRTAGILRVMQTALMRMFDLRVPVVSAPMAGVAGGRLAAAVSASGGLGMVGIGSTTPPDWIDEQLALAAAGGKPYGAGLMAWALAADRTALDRVLAARPSLVSVSFGDVTPWVAELAGAGVSVAVQAGTVAEAVAAEHAGAHLVVARGAEAGGHGRNAVATLPLLQQVLEVVSVPVLAAGGIGSARGLAAVLAAGAAGAWVGTAFLCCAEAASGAAARAAVIAAESTDTVYSSVFDIAQRLAWPPEFGGRALVNEFTAAWLGREPELAVDSDAAASMQLARAHGDAATAPVYAGQGVGMISSETAAAQVLADFAMAADLIRAAAT